jgi:hypothetical protein
VEFSLYVTGAQSQSGFTSADGLKVDASYSNLTSFDTRFPTAALTGTINDASWPFQNVVIPSALGQTSNTSRYQTTLTFTFTSAGGLPAGGASRSWILKIRTRR